MQSSDAGKALATCEVGRFLVRLGHKLPGSFVVTHLKQVFRFLFFFQ